MLKFLFNRESKIVYAMEIIGLVFLILLLFSWWPSGRPGIQKFAFFLYIVLYLLIRSFSLISWYDKDGRNTLTLPKLYKRDTRYEMRDTCLPAGRAKYEGIELQFKKAVIPTSYILAIFSGLLLAGVHGWVLYMADVLFIVIVHVNFILLYFHLKDKETLPVNYFTHNKHLKQDAGNTKQEA